MLRQMHISHLSPGHQLAAPATPPGLTRGVVLQRLAALGLPKREAAHLQAQLPRALQPDGTGTGAGAEFFRALIAYIKSRVDLL